MNSNQWLHRPARVCFTLCRVNHRFHRSRVNPVRRKEIRRPFLIFRRYRERRRLHRRWNARTVEDIQVTHGFVHAAKSGKSQLIGNLQGGTSDLPRCNP